MDHPESSLHRLLINAARHIQLPLPDTLRESDSPLLLSQILKATGVTLQFDRTGPSPVLARQLSDTCLAAAHQLRDVSATQGRVSREGAQTMSKLWNAAHAEQTRAWAKDAFSYVHGAVAKADPNSPAQPVKDKKAIFNHEYTPLLEKYFEYNAYPSAPDRAVLARKSMMTPRQIEVWFQNHRNRARKDGRPLRKLTEDPLPLEISLKSLEHKMPFFTIPEHQRKSALKPELCEGDRSDEECMYSIQAPSFDSTAADALNAPTPAHAFPILYPPRCHYDPFPTKTGTYKFPPPVWFRTPATAHPTIRSSIDMDDFIAEFDTKLHLRAPASKKRRSKLAQSWCASRFTILPPAPHPAFVRSPISLPSKHASHLPAVPAPPSRLHAFRSPSPFSQPTNLIPTQQSHDTPVRRKVARLPKRTPKNASVTHHRGSQGFSEASPAPSRSSSSTCSSSFGSELPSDRRPSSSSGSSSSSSSTLTTPELPYVILPGDTQSFSVSVSGLDFEHPDSLFNGCREALSPIEGPPFSFSMAAQQKQPSTFGFEATPVGFLRSRNSPGRSRASPS